MRERYLYYRMFLWADFKYYMRWHWEYIASIVICSSLALFYNYWHKPNRAFQPDGISAIQKRTRR